MANEKITRIPISISRDESTAIKGLLIMLIILGHNHILAPYGSSLFIYLYSFHLMCFFILPWFYYSKHNTISWDYVIAILRRNYVPYTFFFWFCFALFVLKERTLDINWIQTFKGYFISSPLNLRLSVGFIFLWFLPSFASFSVLKLLCKVSTPLKLLLLIGSFCIIFLPWNMQEWLKNNLPFGLFFAAKFLFLGWITVRCLTYVPYARYVGGIVFVIISILHFMGIKQGLIMQFLPIFAFQTILLFKKLVCNPILRAIGKYSLCIYLTHMFISTGLYRVFPPTLIYGALAYGITLATSYVIAVFIYRTKLDKIIFPK